MKEQVKGVWAAALTPLNKAKNIDVPRLVAHVKWLLSEGCHGIVLFGTTGEASSFTLVERQEALEALINAGINSNKIIVGTGCCALQDTVTLTGHATNLRCAGVLVISPYFFKGITNDGIYQGYAQLIEQVGPEIKLFLYHFPDMSAVSIEHSVIEKLLENYPEQLKGVKDSSGDFDNMVAMTEKFPQLAIFSGDDHLLLPLLDAGGAGSITATVNILPHLMREVYDNWQSKRPQSLDTLKMIDDIWEKTFLQFPITEGLKAYIAHETSDEAWDIVRLPLMPLNDDSRDNLFNRINAFGFKLLSSQKTLMNKG